MGADRPGLLIRGGRVIDPASRFDGVADVRVSGGRIVEVGAIAPDSVSRHIDATGLVVSPGFIDIHSHAQTRAGLTLQAQDGVTTSLDLESGSFPVQLQYETCQAESRPINYGFSASWAIARMHVMAGLPLPRRDARGHLPLGVEVFQRNQSLKGWHRTATAHESDKIMGLLADQLGAGAIGIGVLLGYAPGSGREELLRLGRLAASAGVGLFVHGRFMSNEEPHSSLEAILELISIAAATGAHVHICHVNSTSLDQVALAAEAIEIAAASGVPITTEAYPYTSFSTGVGAPFLDPTNHERLGIEVSSIHYLPLGRRLESIDELIHLRTTEPGGLCLVDYLDESTRDQELLIRSMTIDGAIIASDAMPMVDASGTYLYSDRVEPGARTHPRSTGTFARTFGWLVRDLKRMSLSDAIWRASTRPAQILSSSVSSFRKKGRLEVGYDADITIFDPLTISDRGGGATPTASTGIEHVLVGGSQVIDCGSLTTTLRAGRAIRGDRI